MAIRVDVNSLSDEVRESLERGEVVEIERDGELIGRFERCGEPRLVDWHAYVEARRQDPPLDDEFEQDLARARRLINEPVETEPWE